MFHDAGVRVAPDGQTVSPAVRVIRVVRLTLPFVRRVERADPVERVACRALHRLSGDTRGQHVPIGHHVGPRYFPVGRAERDLQRRAWRYPHERRGRLDFMHAAIHVERLEASGAQFRSIGTDPLRFKQTGVTEIQRPRLVAADRNGVSSLVFEG